MTHKNGTQALAEAEVKQTQPAPPVISAEARINGFAQALEQLQLHYGVEVVAVAGQARIVQAGTLINIETSAQLGFNINPDWNQSKE